MTEETLCRLEAERDALRDALKPFANFWLSRAPFTSETPDDQAYITSPGLDGPVSLPVGAFRRAVREIGAR